MKILFINSVCGIGSTGRICTDLAQKYESEGNEEKITDPARTAHALRPGGKELTRWNTQISIFWVSAASA